MLKHGKHKNSLLQRSFDKYKESAFSWDILEVVDTRDDLTEYEQVYIDLYKSKTSGVFNLGPARPTLGIKRTQDSIAKQSNTRKLNGITTTFTFDGIDATLDHHCARYNIKIKTVRNYVHRNKMSVVDAINLAIDKGHFISCDNQIMRLYTIGYETKRLHEWSKYTSLPYNTVKYKFDRGWDLDDIITFSLVEDKTDRIKFANYVSAKIQGKLINLLGVIGTLNYFVEHLGLPNTTIRRLMRKGLDADEACMVWLVKKNPSMLGISVEGVDYKEIFENLASGENLFLSEITKRGIDPNDYKL